MTTGQKESYADSINKNSILYYIFYLVNKHHIYNNSLKLTMLMFLYSNNIFKF